MDYHPVAFYMSKKDAPLLALSLLSSLSSAADQQTLVSLEIMPDYGAGSEEALDFHLMVYHLATQVPYGKVTSYGHLAYLAGKAENSRQVGFALKHLPQATSFHYNSESVPWWRIIGASGHISTIAKRQHQLQRLRQEIPVTDKGAVNLSLYGWFPEIEELNIDVVYPS